VVVDPVDEIVVVGGVVVIMYTNNTPYNHYLVDWINYHK
jgi:hypothetical protein